jgi:hypothetical protein
MPGYVSIEMIANRIQFFIQLDDGLHWSHRMGDQKGEEVACKFDDVIW